jgi:hypothetical protein
LRSAFNNTAVRNVRFGGGGTLLPGQTIQLLGGAIVGLVCW